MKRLLSLLILVVLSPLPLVHSVPLVARFGQLYVLCSVTNQAGLIQPVFFLVDTGTPVTEVGYSILGHGPWETVPSPILTQTLYGERSYDNRLRLNKLEVGGRSFTGLEPPLVDVFEEGNISVDGVTYYPVVGLLGADVLFSGSLFLSIATGTMEWTETAPFPSERIVPLRELPGHTYGIDWQPTVNQGNLTPLLDTGSVEITVPQEELSRLQSEHPRRWLQWNDAPGHIAFSKGSWALGNPFDSRLNDDLWVTGLNRPSTHLIGTEALSRWDLWFHIRGYLNAELSLREAPLAAQARFRETIDTEGWGFLKNSWGFRVNHDTGAVKWVLTWGDGTPLTPDVLLGDTLVEVDGRPWKGGPNFSFPSGVYASEFVWKAADGSTKRTRAQKLPVR